MPDRRRVPSQFTRPDEWRWSGDEWKNWEGGQWWMQQPSGHAWRNFGRRIFIGFLLFAGTAVLVLGALLVLLFRTLGTMFFAGPLALVIVAALLARSGCRTWRPMRRIISAAAMLADGDYSARVSSGGSATVRPVVESFNQMAARLEHSDEQRRRLLADLGHELRTPLTVVRGEVEAMLDGVHPPDPEHLQLLIDEVAVMERLLEDLSTLSMAEAGSLTLHPEPTDVADLVRDVALSHGRAATAVSVDVSVPEDLEIVVDPVRIREVVTNLVVNAIRAMPSGGTLSAAVEDGGDVVELRIGDTGVGIAASELDGVFDRFAKGSTSVGSGLGLTISRDLVEAHGGTITLASTEGAGTTATVTLPKITAAAVEL